MFILVSVCRWHCMICSISLVYPPTLPSLLLYVDLQPHYHITADAYSVLHITTCLDFLSSSSAVLSTQSLSFLYSTIFIFIHLHATPLLSIETVFSAAFLIPVFLLSCTVQLPFTPSLFPMSSPVFLYLYSL